MPPKKTPTKKSKMPPRKKAPPAAPKVDDLAEAVSNLKVTKAPASEVPTFSMDFNCPWMAYYFTIDQRDHVRIDLYTPTLFDNFFLPHVEREHPRTLLVGIVVPSAFPARDRLDAVHAQDTGFNADTHMNTAYKKVANDVNEKFDVEGAPEVVFLGSPQEIPLLIDCEGDTMEWEVQYIANTDDNLTDELGGQQFHTILSVILRSVHRPRNRVAGRRRVIAPPGVAPPQNQQQQQQGGQQQQQANNNMQP
jgi:hypothetical protein